MTLLGKFRVFASHYTFVLCDFGDDDAVDNVPQWTPRTHKRGYVVGQGAALVTSRADLNDVIVSVERSQSEPAIAGADRHVRFRLRLPSGVLQVAGLMDEPSPPYNKVKVKPGSYAVHVFSFNLGVDQAERGERVRLSNKARFARSDYEHHRVVLVPLK